MSQPWTVVHDASSLYWFTSVYTRRNQKSTNHRLVFISQRFCCLSFCFWCLRQRCVQKRFDLVDHGVFNAEPTDVCIRLFEPVRLPADKYARDAAHLRLSLLLIHSTIDDLDGLSVSDR